MKKLLIVLPFLFAAGTTGAEMQPNLSLEERSEMVSPCRYWRNVSGGGYVCSSYAFSMRVPDSRDVDLEISRLERRIERLENKIAELEAK